MNDAMIFLTKAERRAGLPELRRLAQAQGKGGVGEGTVEKARRLMAGVPVSEFLGSPPPNAKENELRTLAKEVGKAITDQLRDKVDQAQAEGLGLPPRRK